MKKHKIFKTLGIASLAILMGFGGTIAFVPFGTSTQANTLTSSITADEQATSEIGLIQPKTNDPVLFTTEDGLEIKWGNAASLQGGGKESGTYSYSSTYSSVTPNLISPPSNITQQTLSSGNLSGFPYFTTTGTGGTYTWVIIGRNSNVTNATYASMNKPNISGSQSSAKIEYKTLNDWKAKIGNSDTYKNFVEGYSPTYKSFFNNTYETTSPAGAAINNNGLLSAVTARNYSASTSYTYTDSYMKISAISAVKTNAEIPSGCVLVLANAIVGTTYYSSSGGDIGSGDLSSRSSATLPVLGLTNISSRIQKTTVQRRQWDGSTSTQSNLTLFSLGAVLSSYKWSNYLTAAQIKTTSNFWTGDSYSGYVAGYINTSGGYTTGRGTIGIRPAFVLKVT